MEKYKVKENLSGQTYVKKMCLRVILYDKSNLIFGKIFLCSTPINRNQSVAIYLIFNQLAKRFKSQLFIPGSHCPTDNVLKLFVFSICSVP